VNRSESKRLSSLVGSEDLLDGAFVVESELSNMLGS
jgi:hypothetical protein